jgi:hypothetical protein
MSGVDPRYLDRMDPAMVPILRAKTPEERLRNAASLWRAAQTMLTNLIAAEHPDWSAAKVGREVASRISHGAS